MKRAPTAPATADPATETVALPIDEAWLAELGIVAVAAADGSCVGVRLAGQHPLALQPTAARVAGGWIRADRSTPPKSGWEGRLPPVDGGRPKLVFADDPEGFAAAGVLAHET